VRCCGPRASAWSRGSSNRGSRPRNGSASSTRRSRGIGSAATIVTSGPRPHSCRGGTVAFFWNKGRDWAGPLQADNDAVYAKLAPHLSGGKQQWNLEWVAEGLRACAAFEPPVHRTVTWSQRYTTAEWVRLLGTHSDHRILPEEQRTQLHAAVGDVIDRHGGRVDVTYDVEIHLSRKVNPPS